MEPLRLVINGAAGRMGQRLVALAAADARLRVVAGLDSPANPRLGEDVGALAGIGPTGVALTARLDVDADAMIDFSTPAGALAAIETCVARQVPLVLATTGFESGEQKRIQAASERIALLHAPNMSLAVNLTMKLAEVAAQALKDQSAGVDVEIIERHHRFKEDAPSGTALKFGELISAKMGQSLAAHGREGRPGARSRDEIGYHAVRVGDNPGEHTIIFGLLGETIELTVRATSRDCYALGALAAAKFLAGRPAGMYSIRDVLGL
ncbi:MAG: 4-hydroxy-tetrahydrodipicolinate reductase [Pirellulales bacterium]|nr:4-hydroxy-tetrahydrodipicolinate reductase [Pirellulales bacterium]